jgi:exopolysaccharide/PEP-CTERM locus tyrosine autokinase
MGKISDAIERYKKEKSIENLKIEPTRRENLARWESRAPGRPNLVAPEKAIDPKLVVYSAPESMDAENFKVLRAQLLFPKKGKKPRSIMVTSAFPGEGKTYVSSNLAASIAMGVNEHVLLADCDFRKPRVHEVFGYSNHEGLHEVLAGEKNLQDLIIGTKIERLSLLTAGRPTPRPSELLSSTAMKEVLKEVKGRYDDRYVVVDATPSQVTAEAAVLARYVDGVVFVVMAQKSPRKAVEKSIELIGPEKILGIVFNGYSESHKGYYKYYRKYYGKE